MAIKSTPIPDWLEKSPQSQVLPPVHSRIQKLPFNQISWEEFEMLCFRLIRLEANIEHCQIYGEQGDEQDGIDIYARKKNSNKYTVYQCKNEAEFGPKKIEVAVDKFLAGEWVDKSDTFVLCTRESLRSKKRADAVEIQAKRLREKNVTFITWDSIALNAKLKSYRDIVEDFFQESWADLFCGQRSRTDFEQKTDGALIQAIPLDVWKSYFSLLIEKLDEWYMPDELRSLITWNVSPVPIDSYIKLKSLLPELPLLSEPVKQTKGTNTSIFTLTQVVENKSVLIMGSAGAGKSTCLRYLCYKIATQQKERQTGLELRLELPVLIVLRMYSPRVTLLDLIISQFRKHGLPIDKTQLKVLFDKVKFIFLLDGLDEISLERRDDFVRELITLRESYPQHAMVLTTRKQPVPPIIQDFKVFEIQPLDDSAISTFAECYLPDLKYRFLDQIGERKLEDFIQVPLLLTLCLIIFKVEDITFHNLADIYKKIVVLYGERWENRSSLKRVENPIPWEILEETLSILAYRMVAEGNDYSISRNRLRETLQSAIENFQKIFRWSSSTHTIYDLENQLLVHNFLEVFGNEVNFWHASFRDYFAALSVIKLPHEQIIEYTKQKKWAPITAFVDGLLEEPEILRQTLADIALNSVTIEDAYWPVETLGLIGSDTTSYIIHAISEPNFEPVYYLVGGILDKRDFEGKEIFQDVFGTMLAISGGEFYLEDSVEWFPDTELIHFPHFYSHYTNIMCALSTGDIVKANSYTENLYKYYGRLEEAIDPWLLSRVTGYDDFCYKLTSGQLSNSELQEFCRNTGLISSVPYLEKILWSTRDKETYSLAFIAIQCVIRT